MNKETRKAVAALEVLFTLLQALLLIIVPITVAALLCCSAHSALLRRTEVIENEDDWHKIEPY